MSTLCSWHKSSHFINNEQQSLESTVHSASLPQGSFDLNHQKIAQSRPGYLNLSVLGQNYVETLIYIFLFCLEYNGKYIVPQAIESQLAIDKYIDQIAIIADKRKFVSALIVPDYRLVEKFAEEHHIKYDNREELLKNKDVDALYQQRIDTLQQKFAHYEQIKRFTLLITPFSMERNELTNTLKLKRAVILENYKNEIEKMYED